MNRTSQLTDDAAVDADLVSKRLRSLMDELDMSFQEAADYANHNLPSGRFSPSALANLGRRYKVSRIQTIEQLAAAFYVPQRYFVEEEHGDFRLWIAAARMAYAQYLVDRIWEKYDRDDKLRPMEEWTAQELWIALDEEHGRFDRHCRRIHDLLRQKTK